MNRLQHNAPGNGMFVLLRHGESTLNAEGRFSGWADCPLTRKGVRQAHEAGRILRDAGIAFDACFTSVLSRTKDTAAIVLGEMGLADIPVTAAWQLNERHYGTLEGTLRAEAVERYGAAQVEAWRNAPDATPPPIDDDDVRHPRLQSLYRGVAQESLPSSECLLETFRRVIGLFDGEIRPQVESGKRVLVVTHGNPIRALVARLTALREGEIPEIDIPNTMAFVYATNSARSFVRVPCIGDAVKNSEGGASR